MNARRGFTITLGVMDLIANPALAADDGNAVGGVLVLILVILVLGAYFLPSIVAAARKHPNNTSIFFLNLLLGWSVIGWVGALVWALINPYSATIVVNPTSQPPQPPQPPQPLPPREVRRPCPFCAEPIVSAAKVCRFCGKELPAGWAEATDLALFERWGARPSRDSRPN